MRFGGWVEKKALQSQLARGVFAAALGASVAFGTGAHAGGRDTGKALSPRNGVTWNRNIMVMSPVGSIAADRARAVHPATPLTTGDISMQDGSTTLERSYETKLEIAQVAGVITEAIKASADGSITVDQLLDGLISVVGTHAGAEQGFPSGISATVLRCTAPRDGIQRVVNASYCKTGSGEYTEILITSFLLWSSLAEIGDRDSFTRYIDRTNAFTIGAIAERLEALGYRNLGIVEGQGMLLGFPTPLVHSGFVHDRGAPLIVVGHRPVNPLPSAAPILPPAVIQFRMYFPGRAIR